MRVERRDHQERAKTLRRVIEWVTRDTSARLPAREVADLSVTRRILQRLAIRGFVRRTGSGWEARRALTTPAEVRPIKLEMEQRREKERRDLPSVRCRRCYRAGFVRHENVVHGTVAERHFFCGLCGHRWKVKDRRSRQSTPPPRDRANDCSRMWT